MIITVIALVILVQLVQSLGDMLAKRADKKA
jgi:ABC-type methionine transport system permease subunit